LVVVLVGLLIGIVTSGAVINQSVTAASNPYPITQPTQQIGLPQNALDQGFAAQPVAGSSQIAVVAGLFTPEVLYWQEKILQWSGETGLDANLIATVMQIESCGDPHAVSSAGAMGLFQVMPFHFYTYDDPYDPQTNAMRGMSYLRKSLEAAGEDPRLAFAGYNGGISVINHSEASWVEETQRYVYWGSGIYQEATQGVGVSQRLQEWLGHGGASLCRKAAENLGIGN
jgi:soluble lytic murein transglycosylase-like protein